MGAALSADYQTVVNAVAAIVRTWTDARKVDEYPPDQVGSWPEAVCWLQSFEEVPGQARNLTCTLTIVVAILVPRKDSARDRAKLAPFADELPWAIWANGTLNGTVTMVTRVAGSWAVREWGSDQTRSIEFTITAKMHKGV